MQMALTFSRSSWLFVKGAGRLKAQCVRALCPPHVKIVVQRLIRFIGIDLIQSFSSDSNVTLCNIDTPSFDL